jgi:hypothetical protein
LRSSTTDMASNNVFPQDTNIGCPSSLRTPPLVDEPISIPRLPLGHPRLGTHTMSAHALSFSSLHIVFSVAFGIGGYLTLRFTVTSALHWDGVLCIYAFPVVFHPRIFSIVVHAWRVSCGVDLHVNWTFSLSKLMRCRCNVIPCFSKRLDVLSD